MVWVDPNMDWNVAASATECDILSDRDAALASRAGRKLEALIEGTDPVPVRFGSGAETIDIPTPAVRLLKEILDQMAHGNGVALTPLHAELTTRQAADLLQVSRTHVVQLLDDGRIPCRKVGVHRRVPAEDLLACRRATEARRRETIDALTARDQELGLSLIHI